MKKIIIILTLIGAISVSCNSIKTQTSNTLLSGSWELNFISGPRIAFEGLYSNRKPTIIFDTINKTAGGNTSCNNFNGAYTINGAAIKFSESMAVTRMMCEDMQGEIFFLSTLNKVDGWSVTDEGKTLNLKMGDIVMMRFSKIKDTIVE